ncbi:ABC transporter permease [Pseudoalteromonas luteoviolacea B = ATCC 29581]|nr:ABC transporter permease [Pseudoalteromonas luteoviolacea B = ATCC 29581]
MEIPQDRIHKNSNIKLFISTLMVLGVVMLFLLPNHSESNHLPSAFVEDGRIAEKIPIFGHLKAETERSIIPKISGTVVNKHFRPGDIVEPDSVILTLSNINVDQEFVEANMLLMSAEANIKELESELLSQQRKLRNQISMTESQLALANVELEAKEKLFKDKIISQLDLKKAQLVAKQAKLEAQLAKEEAQDFEQLRLAKLAVANARREQANARLDVARTNKENLLISAGMKGVIQNLDSHIKVGEWLDSGKSLGSVAQSDALYAEVKVIASYASSLEKGQQVILNIKGEFAEGEVTHIEPNVVDNQIQVYVKPRELPNTARLNIEVSGNIILVDKHAVVVSRPDYVESGQAIQGLWVFDEHGELVKREAHLGLITKDQIEIISGLMPGERVALTLSGESHG